MRNFEQFSVNIEGENADSLQEENMYLEDSIVIEDEFSSSEDSHDRNFYQQLVSESLSNDVQYCEPIIISEYDLSTYSNIISEDIIVKKEYIIDSNDSVDQEFYQQLLTESLLNDTQDCEPSINEEYDTSKSSNMDSEEDLDVGSIEDNNLTNHIVPTSPGGIKTRLRVRRPARNTSPEISEPKKQKKKKHKHVKHLSQVKRQHHQVVYVADINQERFEHNVKERLRRGGLRECFAELRVLVPAVAEDDRASKAAILRQATAYCHRLRNDFQARQKLVIELCRQQERLRVRVDGLRKAVVT